MSEMVQNERVSACVFRFSLWWKSQKCNKQYSSSHDSTVSKNPLENNAEKLSYEQSISNNQNASSKTELLAHFLIVFWNLSLFVLIWNIFIFEWKRGFYFKDPYEKGYWTSDFTIKNLKPKFWLALRKGLSRLQIVI